MCGLVRVVKENDILLGWTPGRARSAAEDARTGDAVEEFAIVLGVARKHSFPAAIVCGGGGHE
jgi:hypothetical protein